MIKIKNISKSFNNLKILDSISFEVDDKSILGIAGGSGAGKSTLLRCIQGLENVDNGTIEYSGLTCFMFQDFQLFPHMTVWENITYAPALKNKLNKEKTYNLLKNLGIESKKNLYPKTLSGGQRQWVALARSLMMNPDILLCDEPTSGLDVLKTMDVIKLLESVNKLGVIIIIASHDLNFLTKISNRIILLKDRKIKLDISPLEFDDPIGHLKECY